MCEVIVNYVMECVCIVGDVGVMWLFVVFVVIVDVGYEVWFD